MCQVISAVCQVISAVCQVISAVCQVPTPCLLRVEFARSFVLPVQYNLFLL